MDKNSLLIGLAFFVGSAYCLFDILTNNIKSYTITGVILFSLVGAAFIKKSRSR